MKISKKTLFTLLFLYSIWSGWAQDSVSCDYIKVQFQNFENKLDKINKRIFDNKPWFFELKNNEVIKQLKIDSVKLAKELYDLYKMLDQEYFKSKALSIVNKSLTVSEVLHLYYSFDYFKKMVLKKVFEITTYDDIIKYSDSFNSLL